MVGREQPPVAGAAPVAEDRSVTRQVVVPLAVSHTDRAEATELLTALQREGFGVGRRLFVAYVIDFAARREDASAAARAVRNSDWDSALYGDASGWVLRLSRTRSLTDEAVLDDVTEVKRLARRHHGEVRSAAIEDLRQGDAWAEMAARVEDSRRRRPDEPVPGGAVPAPRHAEAAGDG